MEITVLLQDLVKVSQLQLGEDKANTYLLQVEIRNQKATTHVLKRSCMGDQQVKQKSELELELSKETYPSLT